MGSAPTGSCAAGGAAGGGPDPATAQLGVAARAAALQPEALATSSVRRGTFLPVAGAVVKVFRQDSAQALAPFTAITDATGFFNVPFLPPGEPFTIRAIDPASGMTAEASGVSSGVNVVTPVQLMFTMAAPAPGAPTAGFAINPLPDPRFEGSVYYSFDGSLSTDDVGIEEYTWQLGGLTATVDWKPNVLRGYGRNGTYAAALTVSDADGNFGVVTKSFTIDDLPYDYWGLPPERVNETAAGAVSNQEVEYLGVLSHDGRYVAFVSNATNLSETTFGGTADVFVKDMDTGTVEIVSIDGDGVPVGVGDSWAVISASGRYVGFTTANDRPAVKDRETGELVTFDNPDGYGSNYLRAISADGRTVAFRSSTPISAVEAGYVVDLDTLTTVRIGRNAADDGWADASPGALSADGRFIVFESRSDDLVAADANGQRDIFRLDLETMTTELASITAAGALGDRAQRMWGQSISADGRYVTFWSDSTTFPRATENDGDQAFELEDDVYVKDMVTGELLLVATNAADVAADWDSVLSVISADGRYVAFGSYATNLAPLDDPYDPCDFNRCVQGFTYVEDLVTGRVANVTIGMDDTLPDDWDQIEPVISGDGHYISFYSWASNLVPADTLDTYDIYRAVNPLWQP